ncbi:FAD-binding oxidoreductase [Streptomyces sp. NPDC005125]
MEIGHSPAVRIEGFSGELITARHPEYDESRQLWNAMFDRRPFAVARCSSTADVVAALGFARRRELPVAVRCGGHSLAGRSVIDDGIVIDLALMDTITVDPVRRRVRVQGGCLLGAVDRATQQHGLAVPFGIVSHTGVGGLALGGGMGHLMRRYGLAVDSLLSAEVVTADGSVLRTSAEQHPDLFWGIRGGGGNFGIVTEFEFQLHEVGPIFTGTAVLHLDRALPALQLWRETMPEAPDGLQWEMFFRPAFGMPWLPEELVGEKVLIMDLNWIGDPAEGQRVIGPLLDALKPDAQRTDTVSLVDLQTEYDEFFRHGKMSYHTSGFFNDISDTAFDVLLERMEAMSSPEAYIGLLPLGGAVARVAGDATAFPHRDAEWSLALVSVWELPEDSAHNIAWAKDSHRLLEPHMTGGAYVNDLGEDGRLTAAYGPSLPRLRQVKARYDPENVFRGNQNILPAD